MTDTEEAVLRFFRGKGKPLGRSKQEELECRYLDSGVLDSMQMVEMVVQFEKEFGVRFSVDDMQSPEFRTIRGLIGIIGRLRKHA